LGQANELKGRLQKQPKEERNMDLWNNEFGRNCGKQSNSLKELGELIKNALKEGKLITTIDKKKDSREYQQSPFSVSLDPNKPVIVLNEDETGRNKEFLDLINGTFMDIEEFVSKIKIGKYPGYKVKEINKIPTPVSSPDGNKSNNLG